MRLYLLAFSVAVLSSAYWPCLSLLEFSWSCGPFFPQMSVVFVVLGAWCWYRCRCPTFVRVALVFALGLMWAAVWGAWLQAQQLPLALDKTDYVVLGVVRDVPQRNSLRSRFVFEIEAVEALGDSSPSVAKPVELQRVMLSWYGGEPVRPGERWQLTVRLRSPRGFANPGGFDYGGWLFHRQISATGYIRAKGVNKKLAQTQQYAIDQFRWAVLEKIDSLEVSAASKGLLAALTIGDKQGLDSATWMHMRLTGTVHLAVVSGLHIGMVAGLGMLLGNFLGRCLAALGAPVSRQLVGVVVGGGLALSYALLAGFGLSTQRALIMLSVFLLATLLKRKPRPELALLWALALIAASDPLAALSSGFWLSFVAVATFLLWFVPRPRASYLHDLCSAQLIIFLPLAGLLSFYQGEISLLSPLVNLLAIPWLGIAVVPLALLGMLLLPVSPALATTVWQVAAWQLEAFAAAMTWLAHYADFFMWPVPAGQGALLSLALILAGALLLMPRALGLRAMALVLLLAVALSNQSFLNSEDVERGTSSDRASFTLAVLDVGQGLSVVATHNGRAVVYDAGPKYSTSFNAGSGIIAPYLRSQGVSTLDVLMLSHGDADHVGGTQGLLEHFRPARILAGQPLELPVQGVEPCSGQQVFLGGREAEQSWKRAGLSFEILYPWPAARSSDSRDHVLRPEKSRSDNDSSCVLLIHYRGKRILLPGDISGEVERQLLARAALPAQIDVLVAPHHGSRTSSSSAFVEHLSPTHVVYAAGFNHHFGHPAKVVAERYKRGGAQAWQTGESGAIIFTWDGSGQLSVKSWREYTKRYWQ
ncbi:MAG: DNA internalization-related competence protein ComEC/Rec2 [Porticoccaceae bacterium]|nr:DNA internalization-related competence protein ComEC/Rec2 [Porticoccaceae bacterium]